MSRKLKIGEKAFTSMPIEIKAIDKENFTLTMIASTQDVDRHGDTVLQAGWDLKNFLKNPVILNSHNYFDVTEVIAKATRTEIVGKGKKARLEQDWKFAVNENPKAEIAWKLYAGGFLHASSVGFIPRKFADNPDGTRNWYVIEEAELLEVSAVSVPANAAATLAKSIGVTEDEIRSVLKTYDPETGYDSEKDEVLGTPVPETPEVPATDEPEEVPETPAETAEEKKQRLQAERERIDAELAELEPEEVPEPEPEVEAETLTSKTVITKRALASIENDRIHALKSAQKTIDRLLNGGASVSPAVKSKVNDRMYHKVIRELIKAR